MKSRYIKNIFLLLAIAIYVYVYRTDLYANHIEICNFATVCFIAVLFILSILFFGFKNNKHKALESSLFKVVIFSITVVFTVSCFIGFFNGFLKNAYSTKLYYIFTNSFPFFLIIILTELFRYNYFRANSDNAIFMFLGTALLCVFDFFTTVGVINLKSPELILSLATLNLFPMIVKNYSLSYVSSTFGYRVPIVYRIITELYIFVVPVVPDIGEFLTSCFLVVLPAVLYLQASSRFSVYMDGIRHVFTVKEFRWYDIPAMISLVCIMVLMSGSFKFSFLGIASDSMAPIFKRGDAVLLSKVKNKDLDEGDIIAYSKNGQMTIVHRIVEVYYDSSGNKYFKTKGDANNSEDSKFVYDKDIRGKVIYSVKYIAYPTVFLNDNK